MNDNASISNESESSNPVLSNDLDRSQTSKNQLNRFLLAAIKSIRGFGWLLFIIGILGLLFALFILFTIDDAGHGADTFLAGYLGFFALVLTLVGSIFLASARKLQQGRAKDLLLGLVCGYLPFYLLYYGLLADHSLSKLLPLTVYLSLISFGALWALYLLGLLGSQFASRSVRLLVGIVGLGLLLVPLFSVDYRFFLYQRDYTDDVGVISVRTARAIGKSHYVSLRTSELSPEAANELLRHPKQYSIEIRGLKFLSQETASILAQADPGLNLEIEELSPGAANELAASMGSLKLDLETIDVATAQQLSKYNGYVMLELQINHLSVDLAAALASIHSELIFSSLHELDTPSAAALARHHGRLYLNKVDYTKLSNESLQSFDQHGEDLDFCNIATYKEWRANPSSPVSTKCLGDTF